MDTCRVKRCRRFAAITYYGRDICWKHWERHADPDHGFNLKKEFGIKEKKKKRRNLKFRGKKPRGLLF